MARIKPKYVITVYERKPSWLKRLLRNEFYWTVKEVYPISWFQIAEGFAHTENDAYAAAEEGTDGRS